MEQCLSPWMVWWGEGWTGYTQDFDKIYMLARGFYLPYDPGVKICLAVHHLGKN